MKYFLYATTEKKPIMRFFDHWFEVKDFLNLMDWEILQYAPPIEIYKKMTDEELKEKK